jgi:hypothetical protein
MATPTHAFEFGGGVRDASKLFDPRRNDATMRGVRAMMPTEVLLGTGKAGPMDRLRNDPVMLGVRGQGAPSGSTGGATVDPGMTPRPAAAPPYEPPGGWGARAPAQPAGQMMFGSRIAASPQNHSYQANTGTGSSVGMNPLAGRAARPIGRSMKEAPERRLETAARYGSLRAAEGLVGLKSQGQQRDFQRERDVQQFDWGMQRSPAGAPIQEQPFGGHFVPGRSTGSQVWVSDNPAPTAAASQQEQPFGGLPERQTPQQAQQPRQEQPFSFPVPVLPWDGKGPLPPSTLGGGSGVPAGPRFQAQDVMGADGKPRGFVGVDTTTGKLSGLTGNYPAETPPIIPTPEMVRQFGLKPNWKEPQVYQGKQYPSWDSPKSAYEPAMSADGNLVKIPPGYEAPEGVTPLRKKGAAGGVMAPGQGGAVKTSGGNQFQMTPAKPQASTATGQMPNEAYANDLTPEQSLAAAHEDYLATGKDEALRQHFTNFPSPAVREIQQTLQRNQQQYDEQQRVAAMPPPRPLTQAQRNPGGLVDRWDHWNPPAWLPRLRGGEVPRPAPEPTQAERNPEGIVARLNRKR